jgi:O-antigen ligase
VRNDAAIRRLEGRALYVAGVAYGLLPAVVPLLSAFLLRPKRPRDYAWVPVSAFITVVIAVDLAYGRPLQATALAVWTWIAAVLAWSGGRRIAQLTATCSRSTIDRFTLGFVSGMGVLLAVSAGQLLRGDARAVGLLHHANTLGSLSLVLLGTSLLLCSSRRGLCRFAAAAAVLLNLASASRAALLGMLGLVVIVLHRGLGPKRRSLALAAGFAILLMALFHPRLSVSLTALLEPVTQSRNLAAGSEWMDRWRASGVSIAYAEETAVPGGHRAFTVRKQEPESWRRPEAAVPIRPGVPYTISVDVLRDDPDRRPGIEAWGRNDDTGDVLHIRATLVSDEVVAQALSHGSILGSGVMADPPWQRIWVTFVSEVPSGVISVAVGPTPDQRRSAGVQSTFARFQMELGERPTSYVEGPLSEAESLGAARSRFLVWRLALRGIAERPLFGWGSDAFPAYYQSHAGQTRDLGSPPSHAHNLLLQLWFSHGVMGLLSVIAVLAVVARRARAHPAAVATLCGVLLANMLDATLLSDVVAVPLAALLGWASVKTCDTTPSEIALS